MPVQTMRMKLLAATGSARRAGDRRSSGRWSWSGRSSSCSRWPAIGAIGVHAGDERRPGRDGAAGAAEIGRDRRHGRRRSRRRNAGHGGAGRVGHAGAGRRSACTPPSRCRTSGPARCARLIWIVVFISGVENSLATLVAMSTVPIVPAMSMPASGSANQMLPSGPRVSGPGLNDIRPGGLGHRVADRAGARHAADLVRHEAAAEPERAIAAVGDAAALERRRDARGGGRVRGHDRIVRAGRRSRRGAARAAAAGSLAGGAGCGVFDESMTLLPEKRARVGAAAACGQARGQRCDELASYRHVHGGMLAAAPRRKRRCCKRLRVTQPFEHRPATRPRRVAQARSVSAPNPENAEGRAANLSYAGRASAGLDFRVTRRRVPCLLAARRRTHGPPGKSHRPAIAGVP